MSFKKLVVRPDEFLEALDVYPLVFRVLVSAYGP